jgi:multidrug resistance efflux pump
MKKISPITFTAILLSVLGFGTAAFYVNGTQLKAPALVPAREPLQTAFVKQIAGVGIIESRLKNVRVAPHFGGRVEGVYVNESMKVKKGDRLYQLDTCQLESQLKSQQRLAASLAAKVERLKNEPRNVDVTPLEASVIAKKARLADIEQNLKRYEKLLPRGAVTENDTVQRRCDLAEAEAELKHSEADLAKVRAGAWEYDIEQAKQEYQQAIAKGREIEVKIAQSTVRAPIDGEILQVNVRPGEYVQEISNEPSVLLGNTETLQVRVDIDEVNASRVTAQMPAVASPKGDSTVRFPLHFLRIEPYMQPKKNLTGNTAERNDVRVLQLLYSFKKTPDLPVYVGQQVDVFLSANAAKEKNRSTLASTK